MTIQNIVGKPVADLNFFGRHDELDELAESVEREHLLVLAPRRVGKTSLLHELRKRVDRDGSTIGVYASVAAAKSEPEFVDTILKAIYASPRGKKLRPGVLKRLRRRGQVKEVRVAGASIDLQHERPAWQQHADEAMAPILASATPILLLIDELPVLVMTLAEADPTGARVRAFLQWFRDLRQRPGTTIRFILAGSIGLDNLTRRYRMTDTINDLRVWRLGPFERDTAHELLRNLAGSYEVDLDDTVIETICAAAGWLIPYYLQLIFSELRKDTGKRAADPSMVDGAVQRVVETKAYFSTWSERLHHAFGPAGEPGARAILGVCAKDPAGATRSTLDAALAKHIADPAARARELEYILDVLANDGYLVEDGGRLRFRSGLLRRYWLKEPS